MIKRMPSRVDEQVALGRCKGLIVLINGSVIVTNFKYVYI